MKRFFWRWFLWSLLIFFTPPIVLGGPGPTLQWYDAHPWRVRGFDLAIAVALALA